MEAEHKDVRGHEIPSRGGGAFTLLVIFYFLKKERGTVRDLKHVTDVHIRLSLVSGLSLLFCMAQDFQGYKHIFFFFKENRILM